MVKKRVKQKIKAYLQKLKEHNINVYKIILFGSHAKGKASKDSDIDICVVSKDFGKDRFKEGVFLLNIAYEVDKSIEPIPVSLKDFKKDKISPILCEIRKNGLAIV